MARPIAFDRDEVLRKAIDIFWQQGYANTSIRNLVDVTGLQPGSLYAAFGDKRGLFIAALDAYFVMMKISMCEVLHGDQPPLTRLRAFFNRLVRDSCNDPSRKGCLLINTLSEIPVQDAEINTRLNRMFDEVKEELQTLLLEAQQKGELDVGQDPASLAKYLISGIFGLRLYNKTAPNPDDLQSIVDRLMESLHPA